ncbi:MAG: hypothetical protein IIC73_01190 [Armatimonadetes bacterium]|nr:hypothetical protein [Armatimonadota bacterium]
MALAAGVTLVATVMQITPPRAFRYAIDSGIKPALAAGQRLSELEDVPEDQEERSRLQAQYDKANSEDGPQVLKYVAVFTSSSRAFLTVRRVPERARLSVPAPLVADAKAPP